MGSQLNLIYIKLISNNAERARRGKKLTTTRRKKSQCHSRTWKIFIKYQFRSLLTRSFGEQTRELQEFELVVYADEHVRAVALLG